VKVMSVNFLKKRSFLTETGCAPSHSSMKSKRKVYACSSAALFGELACENSACNKVSKYSRKQCYLEVTLKDINKVHRFHHEQLQ